MHRQAHPSPSAGLFTPLLVTAALLLAGQTTGQSVLSTDGPATRPAATTQPSAGYRLVWQDDFDREEIGHDWTFERGFLRNRELQYYTDRPRNVRLENGLLVIEAHAEAVRNARHDPAATAWQQQRAESEYTSASVTTRGLKQWKHARVEVRARVPGGRGLWPAIWMLGDRATPLPWPRVGEIDLMEYVGHQPRVLHCTIHTGAFNHVKRTQKGGSIAWPTAEREFHTHWTEWDQRQLRIGMDDHMVLTFDNPGTGIDAWPFDHAYYLILNVAVGGSWGGAKGVDPEAFPARMEVDWVRVYTRP